MIGTVLYPLKDDGYIPSQTIYLSRGNLPKDMLTDYGKPDRFQGEIPESLFGSTCRFTT